MAFSSCRGGAQLRPVGQNSHFWTPRLVHDSFLVVTHTHAGPLKTLDLSSKSRSQGAHASFS